MGSRDKDQTTLHHQPLLSSLVVRASVSDGGGDGVAAGGRGGSDYEPGEVRREPLLYSRSDRYSDEPALIVTCKNLSLEEGYRIRAGSGSPVRHRNADHHRSSDFDHSGVLPRSREFGNRREHGRFRESSSPYGRGRGGGRPFGRGFDGPGFGPGPFRGEGLSRNNPNVRPREGDWTCPDLLCGNLNFSRREYCNSCNRPRYLSEGSPRRGYPGPPPPHAPPRRYLGPPRSPSRTMNGYRSPPRGWARDGPREFGVGGLPPPRHEGRFSDHPLRRDELDYPEDDYRGRDKFDRPVPMDWGIRDRGRESFFNERKGFERRPLSPLPPPPPPPPLPPPGRWAREVRERSRSPLRGGRPPKDYRRDMFNGRGDRRNAGRGRIGGAY